VQVIGVDVDVGRVTARGLQAAPFHPPRPLARNSLAGVRALMGGDDAVFDVLLLCCTCEWRVGLQGEGTDSGSSPLYVYVFVLLLCCTCEWRGVASGGSSSSKHKVTVGWHLLAVFPV
jgi:hypothetical protein